MADGLATPPKPAGGRIERHRRAFSIVAIAVLLALLVFNWADLALGVLSRMTEYGFRRNYSPQAESRILKVPLDWAVEFGGRRALPRLDRLAADSSLSPEGRETAAEVAALIREDAHIRYLEEWGGHFNFFARALHRRIVERDRKR
ncbi:MAG: hypothetical protein FD180_2900 [Planctomycetota bacterium]|nr:MAG: hypothetical protein FD180_2900 [Planctomycetota bacterium]